MASVTRSAMGLREFQEMRLQSRETREVTFRITPEDLQFYNGNLEYDWEPGEFIHSPDRRRVNQPGEIGDRALEQASSSGEDQGASHPIANQTVRTRFGPVAL